MLNDEEVAVGKKYYQAEILDKRVVLHEDKVTDIETNNENSPRKVYFVRDGGTLVKNVSFLDFITSRSCTKHDSVMSLRQIIWGIMNNYQNDFQREMRIVERWLEKEKEFVTDDSEIG